MALLATPGAPRDNSRAKSCFVRDSDGSAFIGENSANSAPWPGAYLTFSVSSERLFSRLEVDSEFPIRTKWPDRTLNRSHRETSRRGGGTSSFVGSRWVFLVASEPDARPVVISRSLGGSVSCARAAAHLPSRSSKQW